MRGLCKKIVWLMTIVSLLSSGIGSVHAGVGTTTDEKSISYYVKNGDFVKEIGEYPVGATVIRTAEELANIKNGNYVLGNDIDLSTYNGGVWVPIGSDGSVYDFTLDGQGHKIFNLNIPASANCGKAGLFAETGIATIKNLGVICGNGNSVNAVNETGTAYAGGIIAYSNDWFTKYAYVTLDNCFFKGDISLSSSTSSSNSFAGKLIGHGVVTASNCYGVGNVTMYAGSGVIGGLVGEAYFLSSVGNFVHSSLVKSCYNFGDVVINENTSAVYAGGIVGQINMLAGQTSLNVANCVNVGDFFNYSDNSVLCGGIAYNACLSRNNSILNCSYFGNVYSKSDSAIYFGGIIYNLKGVLNNCLAEVDFDIQSGLATIGGIVVYGGGEGLVKNSSYCGNMCIKSSGKVVVGGVQASGGASNIQNSMSKGTITTDAIGSVYIGGVVGYTNTGDQYTDVSVVNSYSDMDIEVQRCGNDSYIAGIYAHHNKIKSMDTVSIVNSYAAGDISAENAYCGGIFGSIKASGLIKEAVVRSVYYGGKMTGSSVNPFGSITAKKLSVENFYYKQDSTYSSSYGAALTDLQMRKKSSYKGFDFENTWKIEESLTAPYLRETNCEYSDGVVSENSVYTSEQKKILNDLNLDTVGLLKNIHFGNHPIKGPSVTILDQTFYLFEFDGQLNFNLDELPVSVTVDTNTKTIKFLFGFEDYSGSVDLSASNNDTSYWSQSYQQVKSMYQSITGKKVDTTRLWNKFSSVRGQLKKMDASLLIDADCYIAGYMELSYETSKVKFSEGGMVFEAGISNGFLITPPEFPVAYVSMGLSASLNGGITVEYDNFISMQSRLNTDFAVNVGLGLQAFSKKIAYLEGGLKGLLEADMLIASGKFEDMYNGTSPLTVYLTGDIYLKGALLGYESEEKTRSIAEPVQLYPNNNISLMTAALFEENNVLAEAKPLSRDYLYDAMLMSAIEDNDKIYSDKSIYSYNAPVLTRLSDGNIMLIWIDDLGTKNDVNKTSLMYSIYNGEIWSEAKEIYDTGTYNDTPTVYNDGQNVHILWRKGKTILNDTAGLNDLIVDTELNYSCYIDGEFTEPVIITQNNLLEINYDIAVYGDNIAVAWVENDGNNPYMTSGNNSLYVKELKNNIWQEKQLIRQSDTAIDEIEIYYVNNSLNCAFTSVNEDGFTDIYNNSELLCKGNYITYDDNKLYYLSENRIMTYDVLSDVISETGLAQVSNFNVIDGNIYTLVSDNFKCELYESNGGDKGFSDWKQVTEFAKYIRDYSVARDSQGEPIYAFNLVDINDNESMYGVSELVVCKASDIEDLKVVSVYYEDSIVAPSTTLPLSIEILNSGTTDIDSIVVILKDDNGEVLSSSTVECSIAHGETEILTYNYDLPENLTFHDINVVVEGSDYERNIEDNSMQISVGYADVIMQDLRIDKTDIGDVVKGTLYNSGYSIAQNIIVSVFDSSDPNEILTTITCDEIAAGAIYEFVYILPEEYLTLEDKMTMYGLTFKVDSDTEDANYANNSQKIVFGELTNHTVAFMDGSQLLGIVPVSEFEEFVATKEGYILEGWYLDKTYNKEKRVSAIPKDISENVIVYANWISETEQPIKAEFSPIINENGKLKGSLLYDHSLIESDVIIALYDNNGMIDVYITKAEKNATTTEFGLLANSNGRYVIKAFFWDFDTLESHVNSLVTEKSVYK